MELGGLEQRLGPRLGLELLGFHSVESGPRRGALLLHIRGPIDGLGRGSGVRGAAEESRQAGADCDRGRAVPGGCLQGLGRWEEAPTGARGRPEEGRLGEWNGVHRGDLSVRSEVGSQVSRCAR